MSIRYLLAEHVCGREVDPNWIVPLASFEGSAEIKTPPLSGCQVARSVEECVQGSCANVKGESYTLS